MKINIGCGITPTEGWTNLDNSLSVRLVRCPGAARTLRSLRLLNEPSYRLARIAYSRNIRFANAVRRIPCPDGSAEAVYSSHMIEHLDRREARAFLAEVRRVLMPGGVLRLAAPDLGRLVQGYVADGKADEFVVALHMAQARPTGLVPRMKLTVTGPRHHLWMYDGNSLCSLLRKVGFANVSAMPPGTTNITDPGRLDLQERASESVYVEAFEPADPGNGYVRPRCAV